MISTLIQGAILDIKQHTKLVNALIEGNIAKWP